MAEIFDLNVADSSNTGRWPEGMTGKEINDAGRADEGILARWYKDWDSSVTASGLSNAYAITSNRTISSLANNTVMAFTANFTNTGAATLNLNGLGAKSIKRFNGSALAAGDIISGQPVTVIYKSSPDQWFMMTAPAALVTSMFADFSENATPGDPAADTARVYAKDDGAGTTVVAYRDSAGVESVLGGIASQAQMEAASSLIKSVPPGRQHHHPAHPKAWSRVTSAGALVSGSYGVASASKISTGLYEVTLSVAMANTNYMVLATGFEIANAAYMVVSSIISETVFRIASHNITDNNNVDVAFGFAVFGDHS